MLQHSFFDNIALGKDFLVRQFTLIKCTKDFSINPTKIPWSPIMYVTNKYDLKGRILSEVTMFVGCSQISKRMGMKGTDIS